jgi:hypothetical protein
MKVAFKSMVAAAAFIATCAASAATITVPAGTVVNGIKISGTETLNLSQDVLDFLSLFTSPGLTPYGAATLITSEDPANPGVLASAQVSTPLASVSVDSATLALQATAGSGGYTHTVSLSSPFSSGGSVTISDLVVDLATKSVYATLVGANGVGTVPNYRLFDFASVIGSTVVPVSGGTSTFTVSGLTLTTDANSKFAVALGLKPVGKAALAYVAQGGSGAGFGSIDVSVKSAPPALTPTCAVTHKVVATGRNTFTDTVTVNNGSSNTITGWTVGWDFSLPTLLSSIKNAKVTSNTGLTSFKAQALSTNKTIAAGASATFSFRGTTRGGVPTVSKINASLTGTACFTPAQ